MQTASEFEEQWQAFLLDGFPGWLPHAFSIATKYAEEVDARKVLNWMIAEFMSPSHLRPDMSDEELQNGLMVMAQKMGTKFD